MTPATLLKRLKALLFLVYILNSPGSPYSLWIETFVCICRLNTDKENTDLQNAATGNLNTG